MDDKLDTRLLLSAVLQAWQKNEGLPQQCAEEQLVESMLGLGDDQKAWLRTFGDLWDLTKE